MKEVSDAFVVGQEQTLCLAQTRIQVLNLHINSHSWKPWYYTALQKREGWYLSSPSLSSRQTARYRPFLKCKFRFFSYTNRGLDIQLQDFQNPHLAK